MDKLVSIVLILVSGGGWGGWGGGGGLYKYRSAARQTSQPPVSAIVGDIIDSKSDRQKSVFVTALR